MTRRRTDWEVAGGGGREERAAPNLYSQTAQAQAQGALHARALRCAAGRAAAVVASQIQIRGEEARLRQGLRHGSGRPTQRQVELK